MDGHPKTRTRLLAQKLMSGIARVRTVADKMRDQASVALLPELAEPVRPPQPKPPVVAVNDPQPQITTAQPAQPQQPEVIVTPTKPQVVQQPEVAPPAQPVITTSAGGETIGWLFQRDIEGIAVNHVLVDASSQVSALIEVASGSNVVLSEFFWRRVAVRGERVLKTVTIDGQEMTVPLISVTDVYLHRK